MTALVIILSVIALIAGIILLISWIILPFKVASIDKTLKEMLQKLDK